MRRVRRLFADKEKWSRVYRWADQGSLIHYRRPAVPFVSTVCSCATTTAPSPMAAPTRLTDPARTSPIAKTLRTLVSKGSGRPAPLFGRRNDLGVGQYLDVFGRVDPVDEVTRHAFGQAWPAHQHPNFRSKAAKEYSGLSRGIPTPDEDDLLVPAQARLYR